jgi:hypothetical protein
MNNLTRQAGLGDSEAKATLFKIFSENYKEEFDCWTRNLFSSRNWVDVEDMKQDIFLESVEFHIENHKYYNLGIPDDYLIKKSIKQTISKYVKKQTSIMDKPHIVMDQKNGGQPVRFLVEEKNIVNIDAIDDTSGNITNHGIFEEWNNTIKDMIPDSSIEDPLDKMIYDEFVDLLLEKSKEYQPGVKYDLRKIIIFLLEGATSKEICLEMGIAQGSNIAYAMRILREIRKDILLPICLSIIDDEKYTSKYWEILNKKGKSLFFSQKNT